MAVSRKNGSFSLLATDHHLCSESALTSSSPTPENIGNLGRSWFKPSTSFNSEPDPHTCKEFPCPVCDKARKKPSQAHHGRRRNLDIMFAAATNKPLPACNHIWRVDDDDNITARPADSASASDTFMT